MFKTLVSLIFAAGLVVGTIGLSVYADTQTMQQNGNNIDQNSPTTYVTPAQARTSVAGGVVTSVSIIKPTAVSSGGGSYLAAAASSVHSVLVNIWKAAGSIIASMTK